MAPGWCSALLVVCAVSLVAADSEVGYHHVIELSELGETSAQGPIQPIQTEIKAQIEAAKRKSQARQALRDQQAQAQQTRAQQARWGRPQQTQAQEVLLPQQADSTDSGSTAKKPLESAEPSEVQTKIKAKKKMLFAEKRKDIQAQQARAQQAQAQQARWGRHQQTQAQEVLLPQQADSTQLETTAKKPLESAEPLEVQTEIKAQIEAEKRKIQAQKEKFQAQKEKYEELVAVHSKCAGALKEVQDRYDKLMKSKSGGSTDDSKRLRERVSQLKLALEKAKADKAEAKEKLALKLAQDKANDVAIEQKAVSKANEQTAKATAQTAQAKVQALAKQKVEDAKNIALTKENERSEKEREMLRKKFKNEKAKEKVDKLKIKEMKTKDETKKVVAGVIRAGTVSVDVETEDAKKAELAASKQEKESNAKIQELEEKVVAAKAKNDKAEEELQEIKAVDVPTADLEEAEKETTIAKAAAQGVKVQAAKNLGEITKTLANDYKHALKAAEAKGEQQIKDEKNALITVAQKALIDEKNEKDSDSQNEQLQQVMVSVGKKGIIPNSALPKDSRSIDQRLEAAISSQITPKQRAQQSAADSQAITGVRSTQKVTQELNKAMKTQKEKEEACTEFKTATDNLSNKVRDTSIASLDWTKAKEGLAKAQSRLHEADKEEQAKEAKRIQDSFKQQVAAAKILLDKAEQAKEVAIGKSKSTGEQCEKKTGSANLANSNLAKAESKSTSDVLSADQQAQLLALAKRDREISNQKKCDTARENCRENNCTVAQTTSINNICEEINQAVQQALKELERTKEAVVKAELKIKDNAGQIVKATKKVMSETKKAAVDKTKFKKLLEATRPAPGALAMAEEKIVDDGAKILRQKTGESAAQREADEKSIEKSEEKLKTLIDQKFERLEITQDGSVPTTEIERVKSEFVKEGDAIIEAKKKLVKGGEKEVLKDLIKDQSAAAPGATQGLNSAVPSAAAPATQGLDSKNPAVRQAAVNKQKADEKINTEVIKIAELDKKEAEGQAKLMAEKGKAANDQLASANAQLMGVGEAGEKAKVQAAARAKQAALAANNQEVLSAELGVKKKEVQARLDEAEAKKGEADEDRAAALVAQAQEALTKAQKAKQISETKLQQAQDTAESSARAVESAQKTGNQVEITEATAFQAATMKATRTAKALATKDRHAETTAKDKLADAEAEAAKVSGSNVVNKIADNKVQESKVAKDAQVEAGKVATQAQVTANEAQGVVAGAKKKLESLMLAGKPAPLILKQKEILEGVMERSTDADTNAGATLRNAQAKTVVADIASGDANDALANEVEVVTKEGEKMVKKAEQKETELEQELKLEKKKKEDAEKSTKQAGNAKKDAASALQEAQAADLPDQAKVAKKMLQDSTDEEQVAKQNLRTAVNKENLLRAQKKAAVEDVSKAVDAVSESKAKEQEKVELAKLDKKIDASAGTQQPNNSQTTFEKAVEAAKKTVEEGNCQKTQRGVLAAKLKLARLVGIRDSCKEGEVAKKTAATAVDTAQKVVDGKIEAEKDACAGGAGNKKNPLVLKLTKMAEGQEKEQANIAAAGTENEKAIAKKAAAAKEAVVLANRNVQDAKDNEGKAVAVVVEDKAEEESLDNTATDKKEKENLQKKESLAKVAAKGSEDATAAAKKIAEDANKEVVAEDAQVKEEAKKTAAVELAKKRAPEVIEFKAERAEEMIKSSKIHQANAQEAANVQQAKIEDCKTQTGMAQQACIVKAVTEMARQKAAKASSQKLVKHLIAETVVAAGGSKDDEAIIEAQAEQEVKKQ